jgi:4-carboxymuconolactone decarboxylase
VNDDRYQRGKQVREVRARPGARHAHREEQDPVQRRLPGFPDGICLGRDLARPGLDRKTRSMITIAMLVGMGKLDELKLHIRATRNTGVSRDEVKELLMHAAI